MGAIAEGIMAYAQPLFDGTDGDIDAMNRAMTIAQTCWNLALLPEAKRDAAIDELKPALRMTDAAFTEFRQQIILPMIQRHREMFPGLHARSPRSFSAASAPSPPTKPKGRYQGTDRYAPCPCGSGRKYKWCCGSRE